jgi:hypothetical protein
VAQGGGAAGEDAHLGDGAEARDSEDRRCLDSPRGDQADETATVIVVADHPDRQHRATEGGDVGERIGATTGDVALVLEAQDDHRRLAGDPFWRAEDEAVEDKVAVQHDAATEEAVDHAMEARPPAHRRILVVPAGFRHHGR